VNKRIRKKHEKAARQRAKSKLIAQIIVALIPDATRSEQLRMAEDLWREDLSELRGRITTWILLCSARPMEPRDVDHFTLTLPAIPDATGYTIHGIAPLPVRVRAGENVRVEPTGDGYNLWEVGER
jgi:hypothetical protein